MDFITDLPPSDGCTNLLIITNQLGKGLHIIPMAHIHAEDVAETFIDYYSCLHGLPKAITSNRGSQFVGDMWALLCKILGVERRLSTAYHPETDGATK